MIVHLSTQAKEDLAEIGDYIKQRNPSRAVSFVDELLDCCGSIADMPRAHPLIPRYETHGIRRCVHDRYLIFYRVNEDLVEVIRILQGARDYESMLFGAE
jgi:toxin ParE1/3/4